MDKIFDLQTVQVLAELRKDDFKDFEIQMYEHQGVYFADSTVQKSVLDLMPKWEARSNDIFIITYPKAGGPSSPSTTWTQEIMYLALNEANFEKAQKAHTMLRVPYLEANFKSPKIRWFTHPLKSLMLVWCILKILFRMLFYNVMQGKFSIPTPLDSINMMPSPRLLKSHLPEHLVPPDIFAKKAKIVYVARNPKDLAVSLYHCHRWTPMLPKYESWDRFFADFMAGKVPYGKWYEHFLGFWKKRHEENILFLKYEDMKKDEKAAVNQICEFLGYNYSDDILDRITEHSTFGSMKKNPMTNPDSLGSRREGEEDISFMRKGVVGDWKNYFTEAQTEVFDTLYQEKLAGTGLDFDFD